MQSTLNPGDKIDRYVVESVLGIGNMATVYGVRHAALGKRHAVKLLHSGDAGLQERLMREGRVQASLDHANIVRVDDVFIHEGAPALLMERVDGPDLFQWLSTYRPTLDEALAVFGGLLSGVRAAHRNAVTHRDLKPSNVLLHVQADGSVVPKVLDFGLAKALDPRGTNKTTAGLPLGTPWYMAPEQIRDASSADQRADVFSLACILYEMVTGVVCFAEDDVLETYRRIAQGLYTAPREYVSDLPYGVVSAIEFGLETDPGKRTQDCDALGRALWKTGAWPTSLTAGSSGAAHARGLHESLEAQRASGVPASPAAAPGLSSRGSGELLQEMQNSAASNPPVVQRSWGPVVAVVAAGLLLAITLFIAVGGVGAFVYLR